MAGAKFPPVDDLFVRANEILSAWRDDRADVLLDRDKCSPWLHLMYGDRHTRPHSRPDAWLTWDRLIGARPFDRTGTRTSAERTTRRAGASVPTTVGHQAPAPHTSAAAPLAGAAVAHNRSLPLVRPRRATEADVLEVVRSWEPDRFSSPVALVREDESGQQWAAVCVDAATSGDSSMAVLFLRAEEPGDGPLWRYHDVARLVDAAQWAPGAMESETAAVTSTRDATAAAADDAAYWDRAAAAAGEDAGSPADERDRPARADAQFEALDPVAEARSAVLQVVRDAIDQGAPPAALVGLLRDVADRLDRVTQML